MVVFANEASALESLNIGVTVALTLKEEYNFQPGQEISSFTFREDNKWAIFESSSLKIDFVALGIKGQMSHPGPHIERVGLFAAVTSSSNTSTAVSSAQIGGVNQYIDVGYGGSGAVTQLAYSSHNAYLQFGFADPDLAARTRIVLKDSSSAVISPEYGYGAAFITHPQNARGSVQGTMAMRGLYVANYRVDTAYERFLGWLDDKIEILNNPASALKKTIREYLIEESKHADPSRRNLFLPTRQGNPGGIRGSIELRGMAVHTASPGILAYTATLPDASIIDVPLAFTENNVGAILDIAFDGHLLQSIRGDDYSPDEINLLSLDISSFAGQTGLLTFTVNTTGSESAEVFIAEGLGGFGMTASPVSSVPEPSGHLLMLAGLAVLLCLRRLHSRCVGLRSSAPNAPSAW